MRKNGFISQVWYVGQYLLLCFSVYMQSRDGNIPGLNRDLPQPTPIRSGFGSGFVGFKQVWHFIFWTKSGLRAVSGFGWAYLALLICNTLLDKW